jgi:hypothetical protein
MCQLSAHSERAEVRFFGVSPRRFSCASRVSVIIPVWRDGVGVMPLVQRLRSFPEVREIIISAAEPSLNLRKRVEMLGAILSRIRSRIAGCS